jgi:hypothetical protein
MKKTDFVLESFKNIQDLIKFIDQKSAAVLVISGLIFTGYLEFFKTLEFVSPANASLIGILTFVTSLCTISSLIVTIYISIFLVLKPRLAKNYNKNDFSLFYFEHVSALGKDKVSEAFKLLDETTMEKHIIDQQHEVAIILEEKTSNLGLSFNFLFITVISTMLFITFSIQL